MERIQIPASITQENKMVLISGSKGKKWIYGEEVVSGSGSSFDFVSCIKPPETKCIKPAK